MTTLGEIKSSVESTLQIYLGDDVLDSVFHEVLDFFDQEDPIVLRLQTHESFCDYPDFFGSVITVRDSKRRWVEYVEENDGIRFFSLRDSAPVTMEYFILLSLFDPEVTDVREFSLKVNLLKKLYASKIEMLNTREERRILSATGQEYNHLLSEQELHKKVKQVEEEVQSKSLPLGISSIEYQIGI